jgi:hypothetical protein
MSTNNDPDSFYPYRVQQEHQQSEIPTIDSPDDIHKQPEEPKKKKVVSPLVITIIVITLLGGFVFFYNENARNRASGYISLSPSPTPSLAPTVTPTPTPTQKVSTFTDPLLQEAYNNTLNVNTMRVGFLSDVLTKTDNQDDTPDQEITVRVEGYFLGATDGNTIQTELKILQTNYPNAQPAFFGQILVNNRLFMKRNDEQWIERDRSDFNKLYENQPIDATAYAYNMVDTLFTQSRALLRAIDQNTVAAMPDEQIDEKTMKVYSFQFSNNDYINALRFDSNTKEFTLLDAEKILVNANITGKVYVDPEKKLITRIQTDGTNYTQITQQQASQLGIITTHNIKMTANLLDFNEPLSLQAPN